MAARAGIEPVLGFLQACVETATSEITKSADAQTGTQKIAVLREVIDAWPQLLPELHAAMLVLIRRPTDVTDKPVGR